MGLQFEVLRDQLLEVVYAQLERTHHPTTLTQSVTVLGADCQASASPASDCLFPYRVSIWIQPRAGCCLPSVRSLQFGGRVLCKLQFLSADFHRG